MIFIFFRTLETGINFLTVFDKTELMSFNQDGVIFSINGKPLKLVDGFIYFGSNISSTESDLNLRRGKA